MNVALIQLDIRLADPEANREKIRSLFAQAMSADPKPDFVMLPELWSTGFAKSIFDHIGDFAEGFDGLSAGLLARLAREYQVWVHGGSLPIRHADGTLRNTILLFDRSGSLVSNYEKIHPFSPQKEVLAFTPGDTEVVAPTEFGPMGLMICYDIRFPEQARDYALNGSRLLAVPANFPDPRLDHWRILLLARAIENQMFVLACNRAGAIPECTYPGHSMMISPWGEIIGEADDRECILTGTLDLSEAELVRRRIPVFVDRRPECYRK